MVEKKWTQEEIASDAVGKKEIINFLNGKYTMIFNDDLNFLMHFWFGGFFNESSFLRRQTVFNYMTQIFDILTVIGDNLSQFSG